MKDGVPVIGQEDPRRQQKAALHSHTCEGARQALEIALFQPRPAWQLTVTKMNRS
jgi:hypothetical protein